MIDKKFIFTKELSEELDIFIPNIPQKPLSWGKKHTESMWNNIESEVVNALKAIEDAQEKLESGIETYEKSADKIISALDKDYLSEEKSIRETKENLLGQLKKKYNSLYENYVADLDNYAPVPLSDVPNKLHVGYLTNEDVETEECEEPVYLNFFSKFEEDSIGKKAYSKPPNSILIKVDNKSFDEGASFARALIQEMFLKMPLNSSVSIIDDSSIFSTLVPFLKATGALKETANNSLDEIVKDIKLISDNNGLSDTNSFISKFENIEKNSNFLKVNAIEFIVFYQYSFDTCNNIDKLLNIIKNGAKAGKYIILLYNVDADEKGYLLSKMEKNINDCSVFDFTSSMSIGEFSFEPIDEFTEENLSKVEKKIKEARDNQKAGIVLASEKNDILWNNSSSAENIECVVGEESNGRKISVWFGEKKASNLNHSIVLGTTGSGKSNFFHALIMGLAERYSPVDLCFYLIDGKDGTTFYKYKDLPHSVAVSLEKSSDATISVLNSLRSEQEKRHSIFTKNGCSKYSEYRKICKERGEKHNMPRILLLIDEYNVLFEDVIKDRAANLLLGLLAQGRSAGIHIMLSSQCVKTPDMDITPTALLANIQSNIIFAMSNTQKYMNGFEFSQEIEKISNPIIPGQVYIKSADGTSQMGNIYKYETSQGILEDKIEKLRIEAKNQRINIPTCISLKADISAKFLANNSFDRLLQTKDIDSMVTDFKENEGIDIYDCQKGSYFLSWIGEVIGIFGNATIILREMEKENVYIGGNSSYTRNAIFASLAFGFALNRKEPDTEFYFLDNSRFLSDPQYYALEKTSNLLNGLGFKSVFTRKLSEELKEISALAKECKCRVKQREEDPCVSFPRKFVFISDFNNIRDRIWAEKESDIFKDFNYLILKGSSNGINIVLSSTTFDNALNNGVHTSSPTFLGGFNHLVILNAEKESIDSIFIKKGNKLSNMSEIQLEKLAKNQIAFYMDKNNNQFIKFKPYSITETWYEEFENISNKVRESLKNG